MSEKTPEQLAAEAAQAEAAKAAQKEADAKAKADKKAEADKLKAQKKADAEKAKAEAKAKKEAEAKAKAEAKQAAKAAMPEQNGIRRPKPDGLCGKAWAEMDRLSAALGQPVPIATLIESTSKMGLSEGNVRAEYARWRKFFGVTGRVTLPTPAAAAGTTPPAGTAGAPAA